MFGRSNCLLVLFFNPGLLCLKSCFPGSLLGHKPGLFGSLLFRQKPDLFSFGYETVYFTDPACGVCVTGLEIECLGVIIPGSRVFPGSELPVGFPDKLVVFFRGLFFQFLLKSQDGDQIINFGNPVFGILFVGKNPAGCLVVTQGQYVLPPVEFTCCFNQEFVVLLFQFCQFGGSQPFQQVILPGHILGLEDRLVDQLFDLGIVVINFRDEIIHRG